MESLFVSSKELTAGTVDGVGSHGSEAENVGETFDKGLRCVNGEIEEEA